VTKVSGPQPFSCDYRINVTNNETQVTKTNILLAITGAR